MIYAEIDVNGKAEKMAFKDEAALIAFQTEQEKSAQRKSISPAGERMKRKRRRKKNADLYWKIRIVTGTDQKELIQDALNNAPKIVETARLVAVEKLAGYARLYPERCDNDNHEAEEKQGAHNV